MEKGVFLCSPTNSTMFTTCCRVAICDDQGYCPECKEPVIGFDAETEHERGRRRWSYAYGPRKKTKY